MISKEEFHHTFLREAFGIVSRTLESKTSRRLRRRVPDDPVMFPRNDVLQPDERLWLDEHMAESDAARCSSAVFGAFSCPEDFLIRSKATES